MSRLIVTDLSGSEHDLEGQDGASVMQIITGSGMTELAATCGGACSCATCHVYVDPAWLEQMAPMSEAENDLLDCSDHRTANSRLSCQLGFTAALDGLRVTIAPGD